MDRHNDLVKADRYAEEAEKLESEITEHECEGKGCSYCRKHQKAASAWRRAVNYIRNYNRKIINSPFFRTETDYRRRASLHERHINEACISQVDDDDEY